MEEDDLIDGDLENGFTHHLGNLFDRDEGRSEVNLDLFLWRVYDYYVQKGFACAVVSGIANLAVTGFVILFSAFLVSYIDYPVLIDTNDLSKALLPVELKGLHPITIVFLAFFLIGWAAQLLHLFSNIRDKREISLFYSQTLRISDVRLQTIEWSDVVAKLILVPRLCIVKDQLTPLDVTNCIMRRENYLIALFNMNIVAFRLPLPFLRRYTIFTKTLEWSMDLVISSCVFQSSALSQDVLNPDKKETVAARLRWRFRALGVLSLVFCPFVLAFLLLYLFFRYGEEIKNRPSNTLGSRQWSPLAKWKFRAFNELPHAFEKRMTGSEDVAEYYVTQFQSHVLTILARLGSFVLGSLVAVLIVAAIVDDDILTTSHILHKSLLWYLGMFGTALALLRGLIPKEGEVVNHRQNLDAVVSHTHYKPDTWVGEEGTWKVLGEFCELYEYKALVFLRELASILLAPLILIFSLGSYQAPRDIVDFFQNATTNVEGIGPMCSCADFDSGFAKHGSAEWGASRGSYALKSQHGKMEKSFVNFVAQYPGYKPSPQGEIILQNLRRHIQEAPDVVLRSMDALAMSRGGSLSSTRTDLSFLDTQVGSSVLDPSSPLLQTLSSGDLQILHQRYHESMMASGDVRH